MTLACLREKEVMRKDKVSHHTGDSIVDPNTVLSMGRVIVLDLPSREAILTDFMNSGKDTSENESSLTVNVILHVTSLKKLSVNVILHVTSLKKLLAKLMLYLQF